MANNQEAEAEGQQLSVAILDVEFDGYLYIAREMLQKMKLPEDRKVCDKYIRSCLRMMKSDQYKVKLHRNRFFRFLLKTMKRTLQTQDTYFFNLVRK